MQGIWMHFGLNLIVLKSQFCAFNTFWVLLLFHFFSFLSRIPVSPFHLLLKAVSDTSTCMVGLSEGPRKLHQSPLEMTAAVAQSNLFSTNGLGRAQADLLPGLPRSPRRWAARSHLTTSLNRSHTESFQSPIGHCLVSPRFTHTHTHALFIAPPCLPSHLSSARCCSLEASLLDLDLMKLQKTD